jgi:CRISPR/Cas system type I-B associated protein Csh2 (Cas7 group RAMP superfamily)
VSASAKITVQIEMQASANWGDDCLVGQVRAQAKREMESALRSALSHCRYRTRIIGDPKVDVIVFGEKR